MAFQISKKINRRPHDVARDFVENHLKPILGNEDRGSLRSLILSVEAHPGGYINFRANYGNLAALTLNQALENPSYGFYNVGKGTRVAVEHTSVNPNKALHVGHLRNVILGDTIYRILKTTNHNVIVLNYVDDSGLQVADIVKARATHVVRGTEGRGLVDAIDLVAFKYLETATQNDFSRSIR